MRPRLFTARNFALLLAAALIMGGMAYWLKSGMPLPGAGVASTAGKIAFLSDRGGHSDLYLMDASGANAAALTDDAPEEQSPAWSPDGTILSFVSLNRVQGNPQVFEMQAQPGARVVPLTQTSSSKADPRFGTDGRIYYLGSGQVFASTVDATDSDAILPNHEQKQANAGIFAAGGFREMELANANRLAAVMQTERGDALMLYDGATEQESLSLVGLAEHIHVSALPDGSVEALFDGSVPFNTARLLFSKPLASGDLAASLPKEDAARVQASILLANDLITNPDSVPSAARPPQDPDIHLIVQVAPDGSVKSGLPLPFAADSVSASPDGRFAVVTAESGKGKGVFLVSLGDSSSVRQLFAQPAKQCRWSPDSKQIAFVSGNDIYVGAIDGGSSPRNVTNGKGVNTSPVWSPKKAK